MVVIIWVMKIFFADPSSKATLWVKAQHEGALPPPCIVRKDPRKKDLHDPDNHDGVITHLEPDILECKVKWALGSITMSRASGGDGIPVELF